jgi:hypothetical protein
MRIIAKYRFVSDIPLDIRNYAYNQDGNDLPLTIDRKYVVAGIRKTHGHTFYLILDDDDEPRGYPWWFPSELFEIEDDTQPEDWIEGGNKGVDEYLTFPELAKDRDEGGMFADNLEDGNKPEVEVFLKRYKEYLKAYTT